MVGMKKPPETIPLTELASGLRSRTLVTLRLATKFGLQMAKRSLPLEELARRVDEDDTVRAAEVLLAQMDGLKGLVMKFGQMASYLSPTLPPRARRVLARLQSESRPMAFERIAAVIEEDLGSPPHQLFDSFEREPLAAASIGQVHRATLDGQQLAVKVQYPGVDRLLEDDFKTVRRLARLALAMSPMDTRSLMVELAERVRQECDYLAEAANQRLFKGLMESEGASVPGVVEHRCSRRVLTSELSTGQDFAAFCDRAPRQLQDAAGAQIFDTAFTCIFRHCIYNADPHPGNYLFEDDGRVVFIDFGCIKRFDAPFVDRWKRLALTVLDGRREDFKEAVEGTGIVARPRWFDYDYHWGVMQYLYQPFLSAEPFTFTHDYVSRSYDIMIFRNPNKFSTAIPPDWLFINRLQWGLNSVLAFLGATAPWGELLRKAVESPTEPAW